MAVRFVNQNSISYDRGTVARIFNEMQDTYDQIGDLWYAWLFSRLHYLIVRNIVSHWQDPKEQQVLDVGCGTGFQSFLYASFGARVVGVDIAHNLVKCAWHKLSTKRGIRGDRLFEPRFAFVERYNSRIRAMLEKISKNTVATEPRFCVAASENLPFADASFTHINCCGSVLSFVADHCAALREITRVLRPGGTYVIEVEAKYNLDLLWTLMDSALLGGRLGYDTPLAEITSCILSPPRSHVAVNFPFGEADNPITMRITLFSKSGFFRDLRSLNLVPKKYWTIHSVTNILPSTVTDTQNPGKALAAFFSWLARVEECVPVALPGCSLVVFGQKR